MSLLSSLEPDQVASFHENGFLVVPGFYDLEREIVPLQRQAAEIIELVRRKYGFPARAALPDPGRFDDGFGELIQRDRGAGAEVYDAVKQLPAFARLVATPRHAAAFAQLRPGSFPGVAAGGSGIRIDNPLEERYRADWHQEYHAQLRSQDGITFWTTLVELTDEMGPVRFCPGSHRGGLLRVHTRDPRAPDKTGAYGLTLENRDQVVAGYPQVAPLPRLGDAVLIDYAVVHASGFNRAQRSRWSAQVRYFNFRDLAGLRHGWCGSFAAGRDFARIHPELVAPDAPPAAP